MSLSFYPFPSFFWILSQLIATEAKGYRKGALPGKMDSVTVWFPKWVTGCQRELLSSGVFPNSWKYKISSSGKVKEKNSSQPVCKCRKINFFYSVFFAKVPGKGEERKDFYREPNFWTTAVLSFQVPLLFTPHCRDPSSGERAISRQCTAAFTHCSPYGRVLLHRWNSPGIQTVMLIWCYFISTKLVRRTRGSAAA